MEPPKLAPFEMSDTTGHFFLTGLAEVKDKGDALHFMARTYSDDDDVIASVAYYLDKRVLDESQNPSDVLKLVLKALFEEIDRGGFE